ELPDFFGGRGNLRQEKAVDLIELRCLQQACGGELRRQSEYLVPAQLVVRDVAVAKRRAVPLEQSHRVLEGVDSIGSRLGGLVTSPPEQEREVILVALPDFQVPLAVDQVVIAIGQSH